MKIYKIRNSEGLYSTGGDSPHFTELGKTWSRLSHVKTHIGHVVHRPDQVYKDCVLCEFEVVHNPTSETPIGVLVEEAQKRKAEKQAEAQRQSEEYRRQVELAQLKALKDKYESPE